MAEQWVESISVANKTKCLRCSWALPNNLKHNEASMLTILTDLLCWRVTQMPRSPDLGTFVLTDKQIALHVPPAHACGVNMNRLLYLLRMHAR